LRFMPALNVTRAEIDEMIGALDAILTSPAWRGGWREPPAVGDF
jgi:acetylornithine/succinyldiaminopimelate/putrescine aminotransferase